MTHLIHQGGGGGKIAVLLEVIDHAQKGVDCAQRKISIEGAGGTLVSASRGDGGGEGSLCRVHGTLCKSEQHLDATHELVLHCCRTVHSNLIHNLLSVHSSRGARGVGGGGGGVFSKGISIHRALSNGCRSIGHSRSGVDCLVLG